MEPREEEQLGTGEGALDEEADSLFIVEGLAEPAEENLPVLMLNPAPPPAEEDAAPTQELEPVTVDLASEPIHEGEGEEAEPEGIPKLYKYGSIAAGILCLLSFGAVYWKKSGVPEVELVAALPAKPRVAPAPIAAEKSPDPAPAIEGPIENRPVGEVEKRPTAEAAPSPVESAPPPAPSPEPAAPSAEPRFRRGEAVLQMHNGSLFAGKIMKVMEDRLLLRVPEGEILFRFDEIAMVLPPGGKKDLENYPHGYVDLANGNRLWGKIMNENPESVTVATASARILVARPDVGNVQVGLGIQLGKP